VSASDDRLRHRSTAVTLASAALIIALFALLAGDSPPRVPEAPPINFDSGPYCPADGWYFAVADGWSCPQDVGPPRRAHSPTPDRAADRVQAGLAS
jgi:hypothetical protein